MKRTFLTMTGALVLAFGLAAGAAFACEGDANCNCDHGKAKAAAVKTAKAEKVSLEGTVVTYGCEMEAKKVGCTGAALVVGETKHLIKKTAKGNALVTRTRDTNKVVKVAGTKKGEFLTIDKYEITKG